MKLVKLLFILSLCRNVYAEDIKPSLDKYDGSTTSGITSRVVVDQSLKNQRKLDRGGPFVAENVLYNLLARKCNNDSTIKITTGYNPSQTSWTLSFINQYSEDIAYIASGYTEKNKQYDHNINFCDGSYKFCVYSDDSVNIPFSIEDNKSMTEFVSGIVPPKRSKNKVCIIFFSKYSTQSCSYPPYFEPTFSVIPVLINVFRYKNNPEYGSIDAVSDVEATWKLFSLSNRNPDMLYIGSALDASPIAMYLCDGDFRFCITCKRDIYVEDGDTYFSATNYEVTVNGKGIADGCGFVEYDPADELKCTDFRLSKNKVRSMKKRKKSRKNDQN